MTRILKALLRWVLILGFSGLLLIALAAGVAYWLVAPRLPSVAVLKDYHMQVPLQADRHLRRDPPYSRRDRPGAGHA
jgi:penicillin-binding protein 1A